jgi:hypothetical protein
MRNKFPTAQLTTSSVTTRVDLQLDRGVLDEQAAFIVRAVQLYLNYPADKGSKPHRNATYHQSTKNDLTEVVKLHDQANCMSFLFAEQTSELRTLKAIRKRSVFVRA